MPYVQYPLGKERTDHKTVKRYVIDNLNVHDKSGKWIVTGRAEFAADHFTGHKLFSAPILSTIAHGNVKSIDLSEAEKIAGYKGFLTQQEVPGWRNAAWDCDVVQWGQPIGAVIADNWYTALRCINVIKVEYDVHDAVIDPDDALEAYEKGEDYPWAGIVKDTNVHSRTNVVRGDVEAGIAKGDYQWDFEYPWTVTYAHQELEAHQSTAWWIGEDLYIYTGTQDPYSTLSSVAPSWGLPRHRCHIYSRFNCGGFGGKTADWGANAAAAASKKMGGYPVLFKNTRQSNGTGRQRSFSMRSKQRVGVMKDGTITGWESIMYCDEGMNSGTPCGDGIFGVQKTWNVMDAHYQVIGITTNTPSRYYWRDVADPPGGKNHETTLDKIAYKLGLNPLDVRLKNVNPEDIKAVEAGYYGSLPWGSFAIKELLNYVADWSDYRKKYHTPATKTVDDIYHNGDKRMHGIAISGHLDSHGGGFAAARGAMIKAFQDGTFHVLTGSARGTAGGTTVCCTVTAEVLGAKDEDVILGDWSNTDTGLNPGVQASSSHTISITSAFYNAAMEMKWKMFNIALTKAPFNQIEGITMDDLESYESVIYYKKDHSKSLPFSAVGLGNNLAASAGGYDTNNPNNQNALQKLLGQRAGGAWKDKSTQDGKPYIKVGDRLLANGQSAGVLELAVDPENGETEFINYYLAVDTGATIFKQGALREIGAATELIHSQGFYFGDIYDEATGADISSLYTEAQFPTYMDMDFSKHHFTDYQSEDAGGCLGCHGIAEPSLTNFCLVDQAIFSAIGLWVDAEMGAVGGADKVLKALERGIGADYEALMKA